MHDFGITRFIQPIRWHKHQLIKASYSIFHASTPSSPILIYLPPGPVLPESAQEEERVISALHAASAATVARINYRASSAHPYPTPYHDVLFGYDWIKENMLRDEFGRSILGRLAVCGQLVGGSLATMLALTECRSGESRIVAAAINNPVTDWVFPDELPFMNPSELPEPMAADETTFPAEQDPADSWNEPKVEQTVLKPVSTRRRRTAKPPPQTSWQAYGDNTIIPTLTLSAERDMLFRRPEHYFDRFASPIHFFRSPHAQLVLPLDDDVSASQQPDDTLDIETRLALNHFSTFNETVKTPPIVPFLARCRAYARGYPQAGTKLALPRWHLTAGSHSPLSDHTLELAKVLRRSIARQALKVHTGRTKWHDLIEKKQYAELAQEQVQLVTHERVGLWGMHEENPNWEHQVQDIGDWIKQRLEPGSD